MKIKYIKSLIAAGVLSATAISCDVERLPEGSLESSLGFQTVTQASYWNNVIYSQLRTRVYGIYTFTTDVQADQLNATLEYGNRNGSPHRWFNFLDDDYTIRDVWAGYYSALFNINLMLVNFENIVPANEAETQRLERYKGEAHLARAFYYHNLVVRYAKMYNPSTASTDLGVPLILTADDRDFSEKPGRSTISEVYTQILSDISTAKTKLANVPGSPGSIRLNLDVALALEARVKLYMQDWQGAKLAAESLISANKYPLYSTASEVKSMWHNDLGGEDIFGPAVSQPDELPQVNSIYLGWIQQSGRYRPDFVPSQWVIDKYEDTDYRKGAYFLQDVTAQIQGALYQITVVNKYPGNPTLFTAVATNYAHKQKVFRIGEVYLIAAEAAFRDPSTSESVALDHLNTLRESRGLSALTGVSGQDLFNAIKDERFKELAFEGFRLDDLRRWNEGFERRDPQSLDFIVKGEHFETKKVNAGDDKFTWGIPARDRTVNPNLRDQQNSGW